MQAGPPQCVFPQQRTFPAKHTGHMDTNAPILFRLVEREVKVIELDLIVVLVENSTADVSWITWMIRTPVISAVEKTTDVDPDRTFESRLIHGDPIVHNPNTAFQTQPSWL